MSARAQLILLHDGFESPAISGHALNVSGAFTFGAWSGWSPGGGGNAGFVNGPDNGLAPAEGAQHFAFNGGWPAAGGWIETAFGTGDGGQGTGQYQLSFALGRAGQVGQLLHAKVEVFASGALVMEEIAIPEQRIGYTWFAFDFVGGGDLRIRFTDVSAANQVSDLYLDAVTISLVTSTATGAGAAVPEPGTWAQFAGFAVLGVAALRRRRRRQWGMKADSSDLGR